MRLVTKTLTVLLGVSVCTLSGYLLYLFLQKDEDDDYNSPLSVSSKYKIIEVKVPKDIVRTLIGRNGKNIKFIEEQSSTRINFKDREGIQEKICVIRGTTESCIIAENLIQDFIYNQPVLECEDIWVPIGCVGKIIGRCGEKIHEIRNLSGAQLTVMDDEKTLNTTKITIKGTIEQIKMAKSLVEEIVVQSQQSQKVINETLAKREPRVPKSPETVSKNSQIPKVEQISSLSGQPNAQFEVYVSAMVDPSRFWLQIVGQKATELDCLVEEMTEYYNKPENRSQHVLYEVNVGDLVAGVFQYDNKWYRAEVINVLASDQNEEKVAELYFVDYGDTEKVFCKDLMELRTDFLRLHFQAIECYLAKVEPVGDKWSEAAIDTFEECTQVAQWIKLSAKINGYTVREKTRAKRDGSPVPGVDLVNINSEQDMDVAEVLVKKGLAVFKKETDLRSSSRTTSTSNISVASSS